MAKENRGDVATQRAEQERLKSLQGEQGSGGSYGTGGGFDGDGQSAPEDRRPGRPRVPVAPGKDRAEIQGEFGEDVGPDGRPIEGPPRDPGDARHGLSQNSGYTRSSEHAPGAARSGEREPAASGRHGSQE